MVTVTDTSGKTVSVPDTYLKQYLTANPGAKVNTSSTTSTRTYTPPAVTRSEMVTGQNYVMYNGRIAREADLPRNVRKAIRRHANPIQLYRMGIEADADNTAYKVVTSGNDFKRTGVSSYLRQQYQKYFDTGNVKYINAILNYKMMTEGARSAFAERERFISMGIRHTGLTGAYGGGIPGRVSHEKPGKEFTLGMEKLRAEKNPERSNVSISEYVFSGGMQIKRGGERIKTSSEEGKQIEKQLWWQQRAREINAAQKQMFWAVTRAPNANQALIEKYSRTQDNPNIGTFQQIYSKGQLVYSEGTRGIGDTPINIGGKEYGAAPEGMIGYVKGSIGSYPSVNLYNSRGDIIARDVKQTGGFDLTNQAPEVARWTVTVDGKERTFSSKENAEKFMSRYGSAQIKQDDTFTGHVGSIAHGTFYAKDKPVGQLGQYPETQFNKSLQTQYNRLGELSEITTKRAKSGGIIDKVVQVAYAPAEIMRGILGTGAFIVHHTEQYIDPILSRYIPGAPKIPQKPLELVGNTAGTTVIPYDFDKGKFQSRQQWASNQAKFIDKYGLPAYLAGVGADIYGVHNIPSMIKGGGKYLASTSTVKKIGQLTHASDIKTGVIKVADRLAPKKSLIDPVTGSYRPTQLEKRLKNVDWNKLGSTKQQQKIKGRETLHNVWRVETRARKYDDIVRRTPRIVEDNIKVGLSIEAKIRQGETPKIKDRVPQRYHAFIGESKSIGGQFQGTSVSLGTGYTRPGGYSKNIDTAGPSPPSRARTVPDKTDSLEGKYTTSGKQLLIMRTKQETKPIFKSYPVRLGEGKIIRSKPKVIQKSETTNYLKTKSRYKPKQTNDYMVIPQFDYAYDFNYAYAQKYDAAQAYQQRQLSLLESKEQYRLKQKQTQPQPQKQKQVYVFAQPLITSQKQRAAQIQTPKQKQQYKLITPQKTLTRQVTTGITKTPTPTPTFKTTFDTPEPKRTTTRPPPILFYASDVKSQRPRKGKKKPRADFLGSAHESTIGGFRSKTSDITYGAAKTSRLARKDLAAVMKGKGYVKYTGRGKTSLGKNKPKKRAEPTTKNYERSVTKKFISDSRKKTKFF